MNVEEPSILDEIPEIVRYLLDIFAIFGLLDSIETDVIDGNDIFWEDLDDARDSWDMDKQKIEDILIHIGKEFKEKVERIRNKGNIRHLTKEDWIK